MDPKIDEKAMKNDIKNKAIFRRMSGSVWHAAVRVVWVGSAPGRPCMSRLVSTEKQQESKSKDQDDEKRDPMEKEMMSGI